MLKQITGRRFSKTAQWIIIIGIVIVTIVLTILMLSRSPKSIPIDEPLSVINQAKAIT